MPRYRPAVAGRENRGAPPEASTTKRAPQGSRGPRRDPGDRVAHRPIALDLVVDLVAEPLVSAELLVLRARRGDEGARRGRVGDGVAGADLHEEWVRERPGAAQGVRLRRLRLDEPARRDAAAVERVGLRPALQLL